MAVPTELNRTSGDVPAAAAAATAVMDSREASSPDVALVVATDRGGSGG